MQNIIFNKCFRKKFLTEHSIQIWAWNIYPQKEKETNQKNGESVYRIMTDCNIIDLSLNV